jgi:hypothetical protein
MSEVEAADGGSRRVGGRAEERLELIVAILLGLAAVATAWAAFQASKFDGNMAKSALDANLALSDANAFYNAGDQTYLNDQLLFLEYERALRNGDEEYAEYVRDSMMRDEFIAALDWYEQPENYDAYWSPFVEENPFYTIPEYDTARQLEEEVDVHYEEGEEANSTGDTYNLITVLLAASLFVLGIAGSFNILATRIVTIAVGGLLFLGSTIWMLTLPVA